MTVSLTDLALAYRQAKTALFYERRGVGMIRLADYEEQLGPNLIRLQERIADGKWFDDLHVGNAYLVPKGTKKDRTSSSQVVVVGGRSSEPAELKVRVQLEPCPDFAIVEALFIREFGPALDALLSEHSMGYRLKLTKSGECWPHSRDLFEYWPKAFSDYREDVLKAAKNTLLEHGKSGACSVTSLDFTAFYDSIDPSFLVDREFRLRIRHATISKQRPFSDTRYLIAATSLLRAYSRFRASVGTMLGSDPPQSGIPIGALTSRLVANVVLARFDQTTASTPGVLMYRRYVDDLVVVREAQTDPLPELAVFLRGLFPGLRETNGDFQLDVRTGQNTFTLQRDKTRVHHLVAEPGVAFLDEVLDSFLRVSSEMRAFAAEIEPIAEELEVLGASKNFEGKRLVALRDAHRETLERGRAGALLRSLERTVRLLPAKQAAAFLKQHGEASDLQKKGVSFASQPGHTRPIVDVGAGRLSTLVCSELLDSHAQADLLGRVELVVVPAWNPDTNSYDHLIKSVGLMMHAYVAVANNACFSDSRVWTPIRRPDWEREACRLVQRNTDSVVWANLATGRLREFHDGDKASRPDPTVPKGKSSWRPLPPGWRDANKRPTQQRRRRASSRKDRTS